MRNKIFYRIGIVLGLISMYPVLGWLYIYNKYSEVSILEKQLMFKQKILFNVSQVNSFIISLLIMFFGILSISILSISLNRMNVANEKSKYILLLILMVVFSLFTVLNIWFIL